jgi:hypothetical protein
MNDDLFLSDFRVYQWYYHAGLGLLEGPSAVRTSS